VTTTLADPIAPTKTSQIWEFPLRGVPAERSFQLEIPKAAAFLHLDIFEGVPTIWFVVPEGEAVIRSFIILTTDDPMPVTHRLKHIGNFVLHRAKFPGFIFEVCD
jgi:hypothetical protein